jgi:hypothetical protein
MKKQLSLLGLLMLITALTLNSSAKKWRVNNTPGINANFSTLVAAYNGSSAGDTLYLEGTAIVYVPPDTIKKKLIIIGPGYLLGNNDSTQANTAPAFIANLTFGKGSDGSVLTGVSIQNTLYIDVSNIIIMRNSLYYLYLYNNIRPISNIVIKQNLITYLTQQAGAKSASNVAILNNYINQFDCENASSTFTVMNNVMYYPVMVNNCEFYNNIINYPYNNMGGANNHVFNNIYQADGPINTNGNKYNQTNIFVTTGSTDGQYKLKIGSPAIGAGSLGVDCGMFGNTEPYVLSGVPALPHIFEAQVENSGSSGTGLPVHLKAKSLN